MNSLALLSTKASALLVEDGETIHELSLYGRNYSFCVTESDEPDFDPENKKYHHLVQIKKRAFSLNFREKALLSILSSRMDANPEVPMQTGIGSDFVAEVIKVGKMVTSIAVGDRVIANNHYPSIDHSKLLGGIPSNHASTAYDILHELQLVVIPDEMSDEVAAAFGIGAQTIFSIIRKFALNGSENALITSGSSNTSLFALAALKHKVKHVTVLTTQPHLVNILKTRGADEVVLVHDRDNLKEDASLIELSKNIQGFDVVVDPFSDVYLSQLIRFMNVNGKYATCGVYYQSFGNGNQKNKANMDGGFLFGLISKNITLHFNCLGTTDDLKEAIRQHVNGNFPVWIDSVFSENEILEFLEKSFSETQKCGKVIYKCQ